MEMSTKSYGFEFINSDEQHARLQTFAESFDHTIRSKRWPIAVMKRDDQWLGYAQFVTAPVVFFAWHTDRNLCAPRDIKEMGVRFQGWSDLQHGYALTAAPTSNTAFTKELMESHLGVKAMGMELFERS